MEIYKKLVSAGTSRRFIYGVLVLVIIIFFISTLTSLRQPKTTATGRIPLTITTASNNIPTYVPEATATVGEALFELGIPIKNEAVSPPLEVALVPNLIISILDIREVTLRDGGRKAVTIFSSASTVGGTLMAAGIPLGELDILTPQLETALVENTEIEITRISISARTETVPIPYQVAYTAAPNILWGKESLLSSGADGLAKETVHVKYVNGEIVERIVASKEVLESPITERWQRGSKIEIDFVSEGGASWYAYRGCDCAASTKYPLGTWLRTTNLLNGKQVIIKTNDWGPNPAVFPERIIDLDAVAFKKIAPLWKGVIPVRVERIITED